MGRYPWLAIAEEYLNMRKGFIAESTHKEWESKLSYLNRVLVGLRREGKVSTTNPGKLERRDVSAFLEWAAKRGI